MSKLSRAIKFILIIWIFAVLFAIPQALQFGVSDLIPGVPETETCQVARIIIPHSFEFSTFVFFLAPMSLITVLYVLIGLRLRSSSRMKKSSGDCNRSTSLIAKPSSLKQKQSQSCRRVLKMLVAVVVAFFVCWAPFHTQRLVAIYYTIPTDQEDYQKVLKVYEVVTYVSGVLYYVSTTINPLLYNIMSNKFREAFKETFSRCCQLACFKPQRPRGTYSILARSLRRGAESGTDSSTGKDDTSVQTRLSLTHKISQDSMNVSFSSQRNSIKKRTLQDAKDTSKHFFINTIPENGITNTTKKIKKAKQEGSVTFWKHFVNKKPNKTQSEKQLFTAVVNELNSSVRVKTFEKQDSTSSCDISNSSLKNFDRALLEEELASYSSN